MHVFFLSEGGGGGMSVNELKREERYRKRDRERDASRRGRIAEDQERSNKRHLTTDPSNLHYYYY